MTEAVQKFKDLVEKVDTVFIRFGKHANVSKVLAGATLHRAFLKLGKKSDIDLSVVADAYKKTALALSGSRATPFENRVQLKENVFIKLDTKKIPVSQLRYEKEGDIIKIIMEGQGPADTAGIRIEKESIPADLLMLIDTSEEDTAGIAAEIPHKEMVRLSSQSQGLSIKCAEIVKTLFENIPEELKESVLFLAQYEENQKILPSKAGLEIIKELVGAGPDEEKLKAAKNALTPPSFWKLLGRALARSADEPEISTTWAFLTKADFSAIGGPAFGGEKTNESEGLALRLLEKLRSLKSENKFAVLMWESQKSIPENSRSIEVILGSEDRETLKNLASAFGASPASSYFLVNGFKAFSEAEIKIRSAIRRVL